MRVRPLLCEPKEYAANHYDQNEDFRPFGKSWLHYLKWSPRSGLRCVVTDQVDDERHHAQNHDPHIVLLLRDAGPQRRNLTAGAFDIL